MKENTFNRWASLAPHHHQIALGIFFVLVLCTGNVFAQSSTAFTFSGAYTELDADQTKIVNYATNQPRLGDVQHIAWASEDLLDSNGKITIALPGENGGQPISFDVIGSYFANETDYALFGKSELGEIALYITSQGTGGSINYESSDYMLYPLGGTKGVLIKQDPTVGENSTCATDLPAPEVSYCEDDCGSGILDVLAMVTPGAQQWLSDNFGLFGIWFLFNETVNINGAFINSLVPNKRVRVQIISYTPDFPLTNNTLDDIGALTASQNAKQTLLQSGADVGILLTNQGYSSNGIANSLDPTSTDKFCIAEVQSIGTNYYVFAHELAHQIGCRHQVDTGSLFCPHAKILPVGPAMVKRTVMVSTTVANTRIPHFSNPDVFYFGQATGEVGFRDNAAQIRGAFCEVADNNSPVFFAADYYSTVITADCPFTAGASVQPGHQEIDEFLWDCGTNYTYQWAWSTNNVTYANFGSNSPVLSLPAVPSCPKFYLRLTVTTSVGCSVTATKLYICPSGPSCRSSGQDDEEIPNAFVELNRIVPNPAQDRIRVALKDFETVSNVRAISTSGTATYALPMLGYKEGVLDCDVSSLPTGLWFLDIQGTDKRQVLKLAIVR